MVGTLTLVLLGVVAYTAVAMGLRASDRLPPYLRVSGPVTSLHTQRGKAFLDRLARRRRLWRAVANFGIGVALVVMVGTALAVATSARAILAEPDAATISDPQNVLVIPGLNDFLPLAAAPDIVIGLVVGLVVHEGAHGLLCRVEDIEIESMGLAFFTIVPLGAFVEPDEESQAEADRGGKTRMFAAGVTANFAVTLLALLLLFGPVTSAIAVVDGAAVGGVYPNSGADQAGIDRGDVVTAIDNRTVANGSALDDALAANNHSQVTATLRGGETVTVNRSLQVVGTVPSAEGNMSVEPKSPPKVQAVNGTSVATLHDFENTLANRSVVHMETDAGNTTFAAGAYLVELVPDGPLADDAGVPTDGTPVVVTRLDGERTVDVAALESELDEREPGETVTVEVYVDGEREQHEVTLGSDDEGGAIIGFLRSAPGYGGLAVNDFGVDPYPAERFLALLGGNSPLAGLTDGSIFQYTFASLLLPLLSIVPGEGYGFAGFIGEVTNFYVMEGPLSLLGWMGFFLANILFWTGWVNFNLALFNCLPAFPLDGGHILRSSVESVVGRLPVENRRGLATTITTGITITMIAGVGLLVFGPMLLG